MSGVPVTNRNQSDLLSPNAKQSSGRLVLNAQAKQLQLPRLDLSGVRPPLSSTSPSSSTYAGHASSHATRQPSKQKNFKATFPPDQNRAQTTSNGRSTKDTATTNSTQADSPNRKRSQNEHGESAEDCAEVQCCFFFVGVEFSTDITYFTRALGVVPSSTY